MPCPMLKGTIQFKLSYHSYENALHFTVVNLTTLTVHRSSKHDLTNYSPVWMCLELR